MNGYLNRQRSEQWMINNFKKIFGKPEDVVVGIGDFEQKKHRKFKEPVKGKGFRSLLRKNGYKVYLVDEFRTSKMCSNCERECGTFRYCENPRPWRDGLIKCHGVLMCKTCNALWNRDENSSRNIYKIVKSAVEKVARPAYLCRSNKKVSDVTSTLHNQNLHNQKQIICI